MKRLLRCCRQHDEQYILHALGLFFAYRGRKYRPCPQTAASPFPRVFVDDKPTGVRLWIEQATQYLCTEAKKRIRKEITGHCDDAQAALMESGLSREAAETRVLEELGDPLQANKAFQKTYLTSAQERYMARVFEFGQTQYQLLHLVIMFSCSLALIESFLALAKVLGWFEFEITRFVYMVGIDFVQLRQASVGKFNDKIEQRYIVRIKRPLERRSTWLLFAGFACLYSLLETQVAPKDSLLYLLVVVVPFLYGTVHRAMIRDMVARLPNAPRLRTLIMSVHGAALFTLALAAIWFFRWRIMMAGDLVSYSKIDSELVVMGQALPILIGLLWFGGHALVGAFFVSKCHGPQKATVKREPEEERPA